MGSVRLPELLRRELRLLPRSALGCSFPRLAVRSGGGGLVVVLALLAAGCGGGSSNAVAHVGSGSSTTAAAPASVGASSLAAQSVNQAQLEKYSQCMRLHGEPSFPDPVNGQLQLKVTQGGPLDPSSPQFQSASRACKSLAPAGLASGSTPSTSSQDQVLRFAQCMRSHGVTNFPDPARNGAFLISGNVQNEPDFQSAFQACRSLLPAGTAATP